MFPLSTVLFPEAGLPLHVFEERYRTLMAHCLESDGEFGVVLITRGSEVGGGDERVDVGTVARIANVAELDDGRMLVVATGVRRVRVEEWLPDDPYPVGGGRGSARPDQAPAPTRCSQGAEGSLRRLRSLLSELGDVPALPHSLRIAGDPDQVGWQLCDMAPLASLDLQRLLVADGSRGPDAPPGRPVRRHERRRHRPARRGRGPATRRASPTLGSGLRRTRSVRGPRCWTRKAVIPSASPWAASWRHAGILHEGGVGRVLHVPALDQHLGDRREVEPAEVVTGVDAVGARVVRHLQAGGGQELVAHVVAELVRRRHDGHVVADRADHRERDIDGEAPPDTGPPSPWMEMAASDPASLPMAARTLTHGPTPVSVERVRTTVAPPAWSRAASRRATSKLKACSV